MAPARHRCVDLSEPNLQLVRHLLCRHRQGLFRQAAHSLALTALQFSLAHLPLPLSSTPLLAASQAIDLGAG